MPGGATLFSPGRDQNIRPDIETSSFVYANVIVDKLTGNRLYREKSVSIPEFDNEALTLWRVDRSHTNKRPIYFLTKSFEQGGHWLGRRKGLEIVHAYVDEFFPFKDSPDQFKFSFGRIVFMLDRHAQKEQPKFQVYLDNRAAYRDERLAAQKSRVNSPFVSANFDSYPPVSEIAEVIYPASEAAGSPTAADLATASDGTSLRVTNGYWSPFPDRSGRPSEIRAEWTESGGGNPWVVRMTCLRSYREGYGETRSVAVVGLERPTFRGRPVALKSLGPAPSGQELARLINDIPRIAGSHRGHMVVIISTNAIQVT